MKKGNKTNRKIISKNMQPTTNPQEGNNNHRNTSLQGGSIDKILST